MELINPFGILQDFLAKLFYRYGLFIARHPLPFIILPILITTTLMFGVLNLHISDDLRFLYSPEHSLSRFEYAIHKEFSGDSINSSYIAIALEAAAPALGVGAHKRVNESGKTPLSSRQFEGHNSSSSKNAEWKNMLRREVASAISELQSFILNNMTITLPDGVYHFGHDICSRSSLCPISNSAVQIFFETYFSEKLRKDPRISLQWPILRFFENKFFLPTNFYGISFYGSKAANATSGTDFSALKSIQMVHMVYHISGTEKYTADEVCVSVEHALRSALSERSHTITGSLFSLPILKTEMQKNTTYTFPYISLTILFLVTFTILSCMTSDWISSKPVEALLGIFSSSLAIGSAAGLLFMLGVPFIHQVTVVPFLAFAIGVDDTYVMLGAWQDTKRSLEPEKRMALTLEEAGSAITVTSITSFLSFGIGTFSATPAISIFCKYIAFAILFDYIYQITFFAAVMSLGGRREADGRHCVFFWRQMPNDEICRVRSSEFQSPTHNFFANWLAPFLCHRLTRLAFIGIYAVYLFFAFYGCSLLKPNLTPSRLLVDDSPLTHYMKLAESRIWSEGVIGRVYVNKAPDFDSHPEELNKLMKMVEELESTPYSMGENSTSFWLREFINYRQYFAAEDEQSFYVALKSFLKISFNKQWNSFLQWAPNQTTNKEGKEFVQKFYFTTAFKIPDWNVRTTLLLIWRNITAHYPEYQALVFDENNFFSDQMLDLKSTTLSSLGTAIIAMIIVCVLFIAESSIVFWVSFMLVSMDIGVCGYLSLWGSDLEPTTVVNILMSIGLCIDFATHVGYRTYRSKCLDPDERISDALGAIGWPVVQAGTSTFLAIIVMMLVPSNVVRLFARTSILVVGTGLFHGLFLLPIIIRSFAFGNGDNVKDGEFGNEQILHRSIEPIEHFGFVMSNKVADKNSEKTRNKNSGKQRQGQCIESTQLDVRSLAAAEEEYVKQRSTSSSELSPSSNSSLSSPAQSTAAESSVNGCADVPATVGGQVRIRRTDFNGRENSRRPNQQINSIRFK